jgi:hypothetical protein
VATWQSTDKRLADGTVKAQRTPFGFSVIAGGVLAVARGLQLHVNPLKVRAFATMYGFRPNSRKRVLTPGEGWF